MLAIFKETAIKASEELGGYRRSKTCTAIGEVECISSNVQTGWKIHWRFNFKLNGKVISAKKLEVLLK